MKQNWTWVGGLLAVIWMGWPAPESNAQSLSRKFKVGDEVELLHLGSWIPASVLETNRTHANVEYSFAGATQQRVYPKEKLRYAWEAKALTPLRMWSDASGSFKVSAVVTEFDSEAQTVTLFRPDEDQSVTLPITKLSESDQRRIETLMKSAPARAPVLPELTNFTVTNSMKVAWGSSTTLADIQPDPPKIAVGVPMGGAGFYRNTFHEYLAGLFPIGSSAGWVVAGTEGTGEEIPSRLVWATLSDGKIQKQQPIPDDQALVAVDPGNQHVLTYGEKDESGKSTLTIWKASPKSDAAKPIVRWVSEAPGGFSWPTSWADFVSPTRVIHQWNRQGYVVWDFVKQESVYSIDQESFFGAKAVLSPGRHYLAVPEDKRVRILDSDDGRTLAALPIEGGSTSGVAFSTDGSRLAIMTRNELAIWTLGSSSDPERVRCDLVGSPFAKSLAWVDENLLLVGGEVLFDIRLALPVWRYSPNSFEVKRDSFGSRTISVAGGKYCYSVNVRQGGKYGGIVVGAVELPGPMVKDIVDNIDPEKLYAIRGGDPVSLSVNCGQFSAQVQSALEQEIRENGWVLRSDAPFVVEASMGRGKQQSITYENQRTGQRQTASVVPYTGSLTLRRAGDTAEGSRPLWQSGSSTGLSPMMFLSEGETAQQKANEQQRPDPGFFERVDIPEKIFDQRYSTGFGSSTIDSRGLTPKAMDNLPTR